MDLDVLADIDTKQKEEIGNLLKKLSEDKRVVQNITRKKRTLSADFRKQVLKEYDDASSSDAKEEVLPRHKLYPFQINAFRKILQKKSG